MIQYSNNNQNRILVDMMFSLYFIAFADFWCRTIGRNLATQHCGYKRFVIKMVWNDATFTKESIQ